MALYTKQSLTVFLAQSKLVESFLPQAAQLDIHFFKIAQTEM